MIQVSKKMAIVLGVLIIAVIIILITFTNRNMVKSDYKELIKAKDETIKVLQDQRPIFEKHIEELGAVIENHQRTDSILVTKISTNRQSIKTVDEKLKNIPGSINAISGDNDALRRRISEL